MQMQCDNHCLKLSGNMTVIDITESDINHLMSLLKEADIQKVDLANVAKADSACVTFLITIFREYSGKQIQLENIPNTVLALLDLYELNNWITAA